MSFFGAIQGSLIFLPGDRTIYLWLLVLLGLSNARRLGENLIIENVDFLFTTLVFSMAPLPYLPLYVVSGFGESLV